MKLRTFLIFGICAFLQSCNMIDAQVVWLTTKNMDFTNCDREERTVRTFDAIQNTCPFDVIYEQSDEPYIIVEGDKEYFDRIKTEVVRGALEVSVTPARYRNVRLRVRVGSPQINTLIMEGSGSIQCTSDIATDGDMVVKLSGSGDIMARKIECKNLQTSVAGSGDINIEDIVADDMSVGVNGSGDWDAKRIKADNLTVTVSGSGDVEIINVNIGNTLSATVSGSGDIDISGHARNAVAKIKGSGDIYGDLSYERISMSRGGSGDIDW